MSRAIFLSADQRRFEIEVEPGTNLMQAAVDNLVPGILGECGGDCSCATCHVFVDPAWGERAGMPGALEADLIDGLIDPRPTSRLACQILMSIALDGIVLELPESQL